MIHTPADQLVGNVAAAATENKKEGFFEGFVSGLILLFSRSYLIGVLIISTFYEAVSQIIEYQMQVFASMSTEYTTDVAFAQFQSTYGMSINAVSFIVALLGTSYIIKRFGTRISLLIYPVIFACTLLGLFIFFKMGQSSTALLWATFTAMVIIKGVGYAINNPTKEVMYIPTSKDAKFKSKGWIDTFGSRFSKSGGAQVTNAFKHNLSDLMIYGSLFGCGLITLWIVAAYYVGLKNKQLVDKGQIIK
jgi:AAA family ATP:ADP antiporter